MSDERFSDYFKRGLWDPVLNWFGRVTPRPYWGFAKIITYFVLIAFLGVPWLNSFFQMISNGKKVLSSKTSSEESVVLPVIITEKEGPVEKRVYDEKSEKRCNGAVFDVVKDLEVASEAERLLVINPDDPEVVTAGGTKNFQGAYQSSFECNLPFVATISATPQGGTKSLGLFFEFRDIFKVLIGDGDMRAVKIQGNNKGERGEWGIISRQYLPKELEVGKEVLVTVRAKLAGSKIAVEVDVLRSGIDRPDVFILPGFSVSTSTNVPRKFRIGINDYNYRGRGSVLRLTSFSVLNSTW